MPRPGLATEATGIGPQKPPPSLSQGPTSHEPLISLLTQRNYTPEGRREHPILSWLGEHTKNLGQTLEPGANAAALLFAGPSGLAGGPSTALGRPATAAPMVAPEAPPRVGPPRPVLGTQPPPAQPLGTQPATGPAESPRGYFNLGRGKSSPSVEDVVNQATGVKPLQPNVPLREQLTTPSQPLYHGTGSSFKGFIGGEGRGTATGNPTGELGTFFTKLPGEANRYVTDFHGGTGKIIEADVPLKKPYEMSMSEFNSLTTPKDLTNPNWAELRAKSAALRENLKAQGYDGIVVGKGGRYEETVVFDPKNINVRNISEVDPIKAKYPDPNVRQMVRANGEKIYEAAKGDPATVKAIHDLTRVDLRQALVNAGEDMGQMTVSNSKFAGQGSITREDAFNRLLEKGLKPNDIVRLAKTVPAGK